MIKKRKAHILASAIACCFFSLLIPENFFLMRVLLKLQLFKFLHRFETPTKIKQKGNNI